MSLLMEALKRAPPAPLPPLPAGPVWPCIWRR